MFSFGQNEIFLNEIDEHNGTVMNTTKQSEKRPKIILIEAFSRNRLLWFLLARQALTPHTCHAILMIRIYFPLFAFHSTQPKMYTM